MQGSWMQVESDSNSFWLLGSKCGHSQSKLPYYHWDQLKSRSRSRSRKRKSTRRHSLCIRTGGSLPTTKLPQ